MPIILCEYITWGFHNYIARGIFSFVTFYHARQMYKECGLCRKEKLNLHAAVNTKNPTTKCWLIWEALLKPWWLTDSRECPYISWNRDALANEKNHTKDEQTAVGRFQ